MKFSFMRRLLFAVAFSFLICPPVSAQSWFDLDWGYRLAVTVTNEESRGLSFYTKCFSIDGADYTALNSHAQADRDDIRVTDADGTTELDHWLADTTITNEVEICANIPQIAGGGTRDIFVYYGNAMASSTSSASATIKSANIPPLNSTPSITISNTAATHNGPGMLGVAENGDLVLLYNRDGDFNYGDGGGIYRKISSDNGATWGSAVQVIAPSMGFFITVRSQQLTRLANGDLLGWIMNDDTFTVSENFLLKSTDNGVNWTVSTAFTTFTNIDGGVPYGQIMEIDGDLISGWYALRTGDTKLSVILIQCDMGDDCMDDANWHLFGGSVGAATVFRDASQVLDYTEADVLHVSGNNWVAVSRVENGSSTLKFKWSQSTNNASSWSAPADLADLTGVTGVSQVSPQLLLLSNGDVLLTGAERTTQTGGGSVIGMFSSVTTDYGTTWTQLAMPWFGSTSFDYAYGSTQELSDGTLYTAVSLGDGAGGGAAEAILYGFVWDEKWALNPYADYRDASSDTAFTRGANTSRDTGFGHNGSNSFKLDNTAGTGGTGATLLYSIANGTLAGYPNRGVALNYWSYIDLNSHAGLFSALKDGTSVGTTGSRFHTIFDDFLGDCPPDPCDIGWYDGAMYNPFTNAIDDLTRDTWFHSELRANTTSNSTVVDGGMSTHNVDAGHNGTNSFNGTLNLIDNGYWQAGSTVSTNNEIFFIDDVWVNQYVVSPPSYTLGSEESAPEPSAGTIGLTLLGVGRSQ